MTLPSVQLPHLMSRANSEPITPFEPRRPCYLVDLFDAPVDVAHTFELAHMSFAISTDGGDYTAWCARRQKRWG